MALNILDSEKTKYSRVKLKSPTFIGHSFTKGLIPDRISLGTDFYNLSYYKGEKSGIGIQFPIDGSYLDPESHTKYKFIDVAKWIQKNTPIGKLLDVGSGPGHLNYWITKLGIPLEVYGSDISEELLNNKNNHNKHYKVSKATNLDYTPESFDAVLFSDILEHLTPDDAIIAMKEAYKVLKKGGSVYIRIPNRITWNNKTRDDQAHVWLPSIKELKSLIKLSGFKTSTYKFFTRGFPFSRLFFKIFKTDARLPLFGTSIYAVAKK